MTVVEAPSELSPFLERIAAGEEIVVTKAGRSVAKLVPYTEEDEPRKMGGWKGRVWIADDFDELPPDLLAAFYGEDPDDPLKT
jgi:prevent-host-death family protein